MIDSGSGELSTTKTIDLKARLRQIKAEDESEIQKLRADALRSYEADFKSLLNDGRRTLASDFDSLKKSLATSRMELAVEVQKNNRGMLWLIRMPLLLTAVACVLTVGLTLLWFRIENRSRVHLAPWSRGGQKYLILDEPGWSLCTTETTELHEMGKDGKTRRVMAVLQEPCKPVE